MTMTHQLQIAVADSSALIRGIFSSLPGAQYAVRAIARNRAELERAVEDQHFDAILCSDDLSGPMSGVDALRQLRKSKHVSSDTALILLVNNPSREHLLACTQAQPDAILLKPFSVQMVTSRLERAVQSRQRYSHLRKLEEEGKWDELLVQSRFRQVGMLAPHPLAVQFEVQALDKLGRAAEVDTRLEQLLQQTPGLLWAEETLARRELGRGAWTAAENRLTRLVSEHPSHVEAQEMLYQFKRDKGDLRGAQRPLMQLARYTGNLERTRELGHLALFNGDLDSAVLAYSSAMQSGSQARPMEDLINYLRALLLKGDCITAIQSLNHHRMRGGREQVLSVLEPFVAAARSRSIGELGQAQTEVFAAIHAMDSFAGDAVPVEMKLMGVEQCLAMELSYQAAARCRALLADSARPLPVLQNDWLLRLHDWARDRPEDGVMPRGLRPARAQIS